MSRRAWSPTDAYVDESQRGTRYALGCVLTRTQDHGEIRGGVRRLMRPRQKRIHFHDESRTERRRLIAGFAELPIRTVVVAAKLQLGVDAERARAQCMTSLVTLLQDLQVSRLVIESRHYDKRDEATIVAARRRTPSLLFEHRTPDGEPLLWIADGVAWAALSSAEDRRSLAGVMLRESSVGT